VDQTAELALTTKAWIRNDSGQLRAEYRVKRVEIKRSNVIDNIKIVVGCCALRGSVPAPCVRAVTDARERLAPADMP
jgi:hypothetical protein